MDKSFSRLRGRIIEKFGTIGNFAGKTSKSRVSVSNKLSGETDISREDICEWAKLLEISDEEISHYFFEDKV